MTIPAHHTHPTFNTGDGFCSITPDELIFSRRTAGRVNDSIKSRSGSEKRIIIVLLVVVLILLALKLIGPDPDTAALFAEILVAVIGLGLYYIYVFSNKPTPTLPDATETTAIIARADIISVTAHEPDPPRDRGRIVLLYNRDDVTRQRTITMQEKSGDGFEEFETALEVLNEGGIRIESEGLRDDTDDAILREPADFVLEHPTFRIRSGFCSITPDEIIFTRPAGVGSFTEPITRNAGNDSRLLKALVGIMMVVFGLVQFYNENSLYGIIFLASGALQIAYIFTRRVPEPITPVETSITSSIDRADIVSVTPLDPDPPRTRGTIVIRYQRDGETRQRTIELEQNVGDGDEELEQAVGVMRLAGIPIT